MSTYIEAPSQFTGTEMARIGQIYTYLYKIHEQLNLALNKLDSGEFSDIGQKQISETVQKISTEKNANEFSSLRSLIVKNAKYVEDEIDTINQTLSELNTAQSAFGDYIKEAEGTYVTTATYQEQQTKVTELIETTDKLDAYYQSTNGYIRSGIISENADGTYLYGIAIGQNVELDADGFFIKKDFLAIYAANKLEFYQGEQLLASFEGDQLSVGMLRVAGNIELGKWKIDTTRGIALQWIGE